MDPLSTNFCYTDILACSQAGPMLENINFFHICAGSLKRGYIDKKFFIDVRCTLLLNVNLIT